MRDPASSAARWVGQRGLLGNYDELLIAELKQYLGARVLEVGCGIGNMTQFLLDRDLTVAVDADPANVHLVQNRFKGHSNVRCLLLDITDPSQDLSRWQVDSALCSNVLEHIPDDTEALRQIWAALPFGGTLVVLVPAHPRLYSRLDVSAGHVRRYTKDELRSKAQSAGFVERSIWRVNQSGALGWLVNGKILHRSILPDWQLRLFNMMTRPLMALESKLPRATGLSLVGVFTKQARPARKP